MFHESFDSETGQENIERLKSIREQVNWDIDAERHGFYCQIRSLISNWTGRIPDLREIFEQEEIEWLLMRAVDNNFTEFVNFIIRSGYKHKPSLDKDGKPILRRNTPLHLVARRESRFAPSKVRELFNVYDRFDVNYIDDFGSTHFHVACMTGYVDIVEKFVEFGPDPNSVMRQTGDSPLHLAMKSGEKEVVQLLLRIGADPNLANKDGYTPLHVICWGVHGDDDEDLVKMLFELSNDKYQPIHVNAQTKCGSTPLELALVRKKTNIIELLLRRGAELNLASDGSWTLIHWIASQYDVDDLAEKFFEICDSSQQKVYVNHFNNWNATPLHCVAVYGKSKKVMELLLRRGADPNLATPRGSTPLHLITSCGMDNGLFEKLFEVCDDMQKTIQVNSQDKFGQAPLHCALKKGHQRMVETLLRKGADPTLADAKGKTPLHYIALRKIDDDMMEKFLEICDDIQKTIQVDAQNESGFTPLQNAVESLLPNVVDVLLDRGADLSCFVFPIGNFCENLEKNDRGWHKLRLASGALMVVERLEKRGYDLSRGNVLTILDSFAKYGLFEKSSDLEKCWCDDDEFTSRAKEIVITPSLSLHDLIQLRPKEEEKLFTYTNYYEKERWKNLIKIPEKYLDICLTHLCEKMSRGYVQRLALDPFQELTRYKLPILCCEKIIDMLKNEDLLGICKAGEILAKENRAKM